MQTKNRPRILNNKTNYATDAFRVIVAIMASIVLRISNSTHIKSWISGYKNGYKKGFKNGKSIGYDYGYKDGDSNGEKEYTAWGYSEGKKDGFEDGEKEGRSKGEFQGYKNGFLAGRSEWSITGDRAKITEATPDHAIYGPKSFINCTKEKISYFEQLVESVSKAEIISTPSPDQWKMILSTNPSVLVKAGAGSGKSTTLIIRALFMIICLEIEIDAITIISFTNKSCDELREKIEKTFPAFGIEVSEDMLESLVMTFHKALYQIIKTKINNIRFLDVLGDAKKENKDMESNIGSSKLSLEQEEILKRSYIKTYNSNQLFVKHIDAIYRIILQQVRDTKQETEDQEQWKIIAASRRDALLVKTINLAWSNEKDRNGTPLWPIDGVEEGPIYAFSAAASIEDEPQSFYANGRISATGELVYLGLPPERTKKQKKDEALPCAFNENSQFNPGNGDKSITFLVATKVKGKIRAKYEPHISMYIKSRAGIECLKTESNYQSGKQKTIAAPLFEIQLQGELMPTSIYEAFCVQGNFIESIGLSVTDFSKKISKIPVITEAVEYHFSSAIGYFWYDLQENMKVDNVSSFNRLFISLSDENEINKYGERSLRKMSHLLIDEFQDISPQIVNWIICCQTRLAKIRKPVSIMAIGDDWQSIYGWRGSAPEIFMNFHNYFPVQESLGKGDVCEMGENYRSTERVVRDAEKVLSNVVSKSDKKTKGTVDNPEDNYGVRIVWRQGLDEKEVVNTVADQYAFACNQEKPDKTKIILLFRRNSTKDEVVNLLKKAGCYHNDIKAYTIHSAKGLQGEVAIIFEDFYPAPEHPFRNRVYRAKDIFDSTTYEQAKNDESLRLAYVAITRGVRRVLWWIDQSEKNKGGAAIVWQETEKATSITPTNLTP